MSPGEAVVTLSLLIACGAGSALAQERVSGEAPAQAKTQYRELVLRYARGERPLAVAALAGFSNAVLTQIARAIEDARKVAMRGEAGTAAAQALMRSELATQQNDDG